MRATPGAARATSRPVVRVRERMTADPVTVRPEDSCLWALQVMSSANVHHLPVLEGERLVGMLTDGDIYRRAPALRPSPDDRVLLARVSVGGVMTYAPATVESSAPVEEAVSLMLERGIGALPVLESGRLVGIFAGRDALSLLLGPVAPDAAAPGRSVR